MAKVKVTSRWDILELLDGFMDQSTQNDLGETVVTEAKQMISEGQSPVRGYGRFAEYKDRTKYPGARKDARPVNLKLTGEMLDAYDFKPTREGIEVGVLNGDRKEVAQYINEGTEHMAQRRFIPGSGEEWAVSIMRKIADVYEKRLSQIIRQSAKKK